MTSRSATSVAAAQAADCLRFAGFELDTLSWSLRRINDDGPTPVPLDLRAAQVLAYLVSHRERVVSKEELFDQVWTHQVVSDNALTQAITRARRALGDDSRDAQLIQTLRNRGYRFIGTVDPQPAIDSDPGSMALPPLGNQRRSLGFRGPWLTGAVAACVVLAGFLLMPTPLSEKPMPAAPAAAQSARLPSASLEALEDVSLDIQGLPDDPQAQAFARSLSDALRVALPELFAAAQPSSARPDAAQLTGTILTRGNQSIINLELSHHAASEPLWQIQDHPIASTHSLRYRERVIDTLAALSRRPVHPDHRSAIRRAETDPQTPFELLVSGRQHYLAFTQVANERAIEHFKRALEITPDWFPAQSSLALSIVARSHRYRQDDKWLTVGGQIARQAVAQSQNAYDAWRALGIVALEQGQPYQALEYFQTALVLAPEHFPTIYTVGLTLYNMGRLDEAVAVYTRIQELPIGRAMLVSYLVDLGLDDEAEQLSEQGFSNDKAFAMANYALLYKAALSGDYQQAKELGEILRQGHPELGPAVLRLCAEIEQRAGNRTAAAELFQQAYELDTNDPDSRIRMAELWQLDGQSERAEAMLASVATELTASVDAGTGRWIDLRQLATAEALRGNVDAALDWRAKSIAAGAYTNAWDETDSRYLNLKDHPQFVAQTLKMQAHIAQMRSRARAHLLAGASARRTSRSLSE